MKTAIFPRKFSGELVEFINKKNAEAPFRFWLENKLKKTDILPRGKFFKGKLGGGKKPVVIDEYWSANYFYAKPSYGLSQFNHASNIITETSYSNKREVINSEEFKERFKLV